MEREEFLLIIISVILTLLLVVIFIPENYLTKEAKQQIIDCQSRGNDLSWCLEVIK